MKTLQSILFNAIAAQRPILLASTILSREDDSVNKLDAQLTLAKKANAALADWNLYAEEHPHQQLSRHDKKLARRIVNISNAIVDLLED